MAISYANPASGLNAGGIGWFDFGALSLTPGQSAFGLTGTLTNGTKITFDATASNISGANRTFTGSTVPTWGGAFFGNTDYTGITGNVALHSSLTFAVSDNAITLSNITVVDALNNPIPNYTVLAGDAESTGVGENLKFNTNGTPWSIFTVIGTSTNPTLTGVGTSTATIVGNDPTKNHNEYILRTDNPTTLVLSTATSTAAGGQQAFVVGFAVTRVQVKKDIVGRINPADQFVIDLVGTPTSSVTTTGGSTGIQTPSASSYTFPGNAFTINESMAPGSVSPLSAYTTTVTAVNTTPLGTTPTVGALPINFTPTLGDDVTYTIHNVAPEIFTKTVDKTYAKVGDILTYTVSITNPNNIARTNVVVTDPTPAGVTFVNGSVVVNGSAFTGTDPNSGITLTSIPANSTATVTWQELVNSTTPIVTPVVNVANVTVPDGKSGATNSVTTQVNSAVVTTTKTVDKTTANVGDILTYTITVANSGNVAANNAVITDAIPAGTTFVAGSVTNATGTPPTLTLNAPVPAGGSIVVTYQVKVGAAVPTPNPIPNTANTAFTYTSDPALPNGVSGIANGNTVTTQVNTAKLAIIKSVDKSIAYIGDIVTYQIAVTNTGNVAANSVVITDLLATGLVYEAGSLVVSVPSSGDPTTSIALTNDVAPGETVTISFKAKVTAIPIPNPIVNIASAAYDYKVDPNSPIVTSATAVSNPVKTVVFRNNYGQQISDLINSVALQQAALAAIANAEGAKIQRMAAMQGVTTQQLLCLNKSVSDMMDSIALLEAILKQKLAITSCQIDGGDVC